MTTGIGPDHNLGVYNNNVDTIERAFTERYFLCKDGEGFRPAFQVSNQAYRSTELVTFRDEVMRHMPHLPVLSLDQVVESYHGPKRRVYEEARNSLYQTSLSARDAKLSSFVKFEKQDVSKAPRVINPRSPRYNLTLGRFLKHAEHHYFRAINKVWGQRTRATIIKGFNADASASILHDKWTVFKRPVAIGLDASKFDMHVSVQALKYEHSFYQSLFPGNRTLKELLSWQLLNRGVARAADGLVKFAMPGTRSSGDLNTSLGNCILMCGLVWSYCQEKGIDAELANNGDDCVLIVESDALATVQDGLDLWFRKRGFAMTVETPVYEFEQIEFCQTHPVQLSSGWRMVRNLSAVLQKDPMCLLPISNARSMERWWGAVGVCGKILCSGVPVHSSFYSLMDRSGDTTEGVIKEVYRNRSVLYNMRGVAEATCDARARVSFYYAFGVLPDEQLCMERYYDGGKLVWHDGVPLPRDVVRTSPGMSLIQ
uniref:RNA-directed RNA polymerase n=1 Tax=Riboviria sp. TaxID=2585031 RepID=A0A6M9Z7I3_9VIRU|nr:MAG: hypothetical protein 1 [Riboviria sp.]